MKSIFICIPSLISGGAQRFVADLACNIDRSVYKVYIIITNNYDTSAYFYNKISNEKISIIDASGKNYIKQIKIITKLLKQYRPSIIHSNLSSVLYMIIPLFFSRIHAKHLFTVHSIAGRLYTGIKKRIMKFCFKHSIIVPVAIGDTVKKSLISNYKLSEKKVECIYNGVDTKKFQKKKQSYNSGKFTFINVGTLYYIKNQELLIDAFKVVHDLYKNTKLILIGDGVLRSKLEEKIHYLDLSDSAYLLGDKSDVVSYLSDSDVYCCSSLVEGLGISVLEAMSCSLPIVTTAAGGVEDIVKDGINGFVTKFEISDYSKKMIYLIENNDVRKAMSINARRMALDYDIKIFAHNYELLYEKYLKKGSNKRKRGKLC